MYAKEESKARRAFYKKYGQPYRTRTPKEVHESLQRLFKMHHDMAVKSNEWFDSAPDEFQAEYLRDDGSKGIILWYLDHEEGSYHNEYVWLDNRDKNWARALKDSELPLYVNDETLWIGAKKVILERLQGKIKEIPTFQDISDLKERIDRRWRVIRNLTNQYVEFLKDRIWETFDRSYNLIDRYKIITLEIEGTEYLFSTAKGIEFISHNEIKRIPL